MNSFIELLRNRRSIRRFTEQTVEPEKIEYLKKAILMSPSGKRRNEWEFIMVQDKNTLTQLAGCKEHGVELVAKAPLAFVILADTTQTDIWIEDCSIASIILQLAAESLDLGSCWVQCRLRGQQDGTPSEDYIRQLLQIPDHFAVLNLVAIGYKNETRKSFEDEKLQWDKIHEEKF
ncbi:MAG: nitroreductase family protein [Paludibacteraceae bacterium]|nr:nitroreductase family protein [Paludibacteraceae bacterium]